MATTTFRATVTSITASAVIMVPLPGHTTVIDYGSEVTQLRLSFGAGNADQLSEFAVGRSYEVTINRL